MRHAIYLNYMNTGFLLFQNRTLRINGAGS